MSFQTSCRKFLVAAIENVLQRSLLKYKSTTAISCLNPSTILYNRSTSELRMGDLLLHLHQPNRINSDLADSAKEQFTSFCADVQSLNKDKFMQFTREVRLNKFYSDF